MHSPWKRKRAAVMSVGEASAEASFENMSITGAKNIATIIRPSPVVRPGADETWGLAGDRLMVLL
jgi:hypothetical protein